MKVWCTCVLCLFYAFICFQATHLKVGDQEQKVQCCCRRWGAKSCWSIAALTVRVKCARGDLQQQGQRQDMDRRPAWKAQGAQHCRSSLFTMMTRPRLANVGRGLREQEWASCRPKVCIAVGS